MDYQSWQELFPRNLSALADSEWRELYDLAREHHDLDNALDDAVFVLASKVSERAAVEGEGALTTLLTRVVGAERAAQVLRLADEDVDALAFVVGEVIDNHIINVSVRGPFHQAAFLAAIGCTATEVRVFYRDCGLVELGKARRLPGVWVRRALRRRSPAHSD